MTLSVYWALEWGLECVIMLLSQGGCKDERKEEVTYIPSGKCSRTNRYLLSKISIWEMHSMVLNNQFWLWGQSHAKLFCDLQINFQMVAVAGAYALTIWQIPIVPLPSECPFPGPLRSPGTWIHIHCRVSVPWTLWSWGILWKVMVSQQLAKS